MARLSTGPWFRGSKNAWYAKVDGRQVSLGVAGKGNRKAAVESWHRLMADPAGHLKGKAKAESSTVRELIDAFLTDAATRLRAPTVGMYRVALNGLVGTLGRTRLDRLTPSDLSGWMGRLPVCDTTKAIRMRSVSACLGWGVKCGWLDDNPAKRVTRPRGKTRSESTVIGAEDHARLLAAASAGFRPVLRLLHATGARPGEVARITAENFYPDAGVVRLNEHKADRTGKPRLIYLPSDISEMLAGFASAYRSGPLLRSRAGMPWTARAILQAMRRVRAKAGVSAIAYGYRHSFATDGLANGLPDAHVAELLGHSSTAMIHKHYAHLTARAGVLREAAALVRPPQQPQQAAALNAG
jgi:integrase